MGFLGQRLTSNTLTLIVSTGGSTLLGFIISILIGRSLGETGLGTYAAVLAWVFPLSIISELGFGTLITRDVAQEPTRAHAYLAASLRLRLLVGLPLISILWSAAPLLSPNEAVVIGLRISAPLILIQPLYGSFTAIFRAQRVMLPIAALNLSMLSAQALLTWFALRADGNTQILFVINTATSIGQLIAAAIIYRIGFYLPTTYSLALRPALNQAAPFAIAAVLAATQARLNILLLEQFSGVVAVGIYAAAWRFVDAGRLLPRAFFDALYPLLAQLSQNEDQLRRFFRRVLAGLSAYALLGSIALALSANALVTLSYGPDFREAITVLQWGGLALLPLLLREARIIYCYAQAQEALVNRVTLVTLLLQLVLGIWLVSSIGVVGAVLTSIIVDIVAVVLLWSRSDAAPLR